MPIGELELDHGHVSDSWNVSQSFPVVHWITNVGIVSHGRSGDVLVGIHCTLRSTCKMSTNLIHHLLFHGPRVQ